MAGEDHPAGGQRGAVPAPTGAPLPEPPPAAQITVADVLRAVEGPLAAVRGEPPEDLHYRGAAEPLQGVWIALRTNMREVLEGVTLADLAAARLPKRISTLASKPESWLTR